jgi:hypothetical protein
MLLVSYLYSALTTTDVEVDVVVNAFLPSLDEGEDARFLVNALPQTCGERQHSEVTFLGSNPIALKAYQTVHTILVGMDDRSVREKTSSAADVGWRRNHAASTQRALGRTCQQFFLQFKSFAHSL